MQLRSRWRSAPSVGLAYFVGQLLHVARGVDRETAGRATDWHHLLLAGGFELLPPRVQAFVHHREPLPDAPCP